LPAAVAGAPAAPVAVAPAGPRPTVGPAAPSGGNSTLAGVTVLVVDDEPDSLAVVRLVLEECGATVLTAGSADEALDVLARRRVGVLVSDVGMPDVDGYEFLRRVRRLEPALGGDVPAAALTAFARSEDRTRALRAGYQTHVAKPVEPTELVSAVASLARRTGRTT
ncbi:MAG TPA: response regulator, partial [Humisphaera sp.]